MNIVLLNPIDVLFFKDGRPMTGSSSGQGAAWPLPDVTNHALHAALHRAGLAGVHGHYHIDDDGQRATEGARKFGCLVTAGPFPVKIQTEGNTAQNTASNPVWFFPRPKDAQANGSVDVTLRPIDAMPGVEQPWSGSSLPKPLKYTVANTQPPSKDAGGEAWLSAAAYDSYLRDALHDAGQFAMPSDGAFLRDSEMADTEHMIGIGIDPDTGTAAKSAFYSAHYLRLRESFCLGVLASAEDRAYRHSDHGNDLIRALLNGHPEQIVVGGQQRLCTAKRGDVIGALPFPRGLITATDFRRLPNGKFAVKWILLSPAVWPEIPAKKKNGSDQDAHPGGWLPNWVFLKWDADLEKAIDDPRNGAVLLTSGPGKRKAQRRRVDPGSSISARLVAAVVPKPLVLTGWASPHAEADRRDGGAKSTQLAVPAGAVYYFEADPDEADGPKNAVALASALNWHGLETNPGFIKNRRSTLMGEKGFGLGVSGTWNFFSSPPGK